SRALRGSRLRRRLGEVQWRAREEHHRFYRNSDTKKPKFSALSRARAGSLSASHLAFSAPSATVCFQAAFAVFAPAGIFTSADPTASCAISGTIVPIWDWWSVPLPTRPLKNASRKSMSTCLFFTLKRTLPTVTGALADLVDAHTPGPG